METPALKVMTWNIRSGFGSFDLPKEAAGESQVDAVVAVIRDSEAGIVGLQEVDRFWERSGGIDQPRVIGEALGMAWCHGANWLPDGGSPVDEVPQYGTAMLSAWPIIEHENVLLPTPHGWEPRGALVATIELPGDTEVCVINTHLQVGHKGVEAEGRRQRAEQLAAVLEIVSSKAMPCIITGDFNALPGSEELRAIEAAGSGFVDSWVVAHPDRPGFTIPASPMAEPRRRIDYVFAGEGIRIADATVLVNEATRVASDHYPVVVDLVPATGD